MTFEIVADGSGPATVTVTGELDIANIERLEQAVAAALDKRPSRLVVDVGGLRFADSSAIALWVRWSLTAPAFELHGASPLLRRVIIAMGLAEKLGLT
jgi:anti-sigma B factor antagonist